MIRRKRWFRRLTSAALCLCLLISLCAPALGLEAAESSQDAQEVELPGNRTPPAEESDLRESPADGEDTEDASGEASGESSEDGESPEDGQSPEDSESPEDGESPENGQSPEEGETPEEAPDAEATAGELAAAPEEPLEAAALDLFLSDPTADPIPEGAVAISDEAGLRAIGTDGDYYLTADIALSTAWEPIASFSGTLDGRGHRIQLLQISSSSGDTGLFASSGGTIRNLGITLARNGVTGSGNTGALVGTGTSGLRIVNCFVVPNGSTFAPVIKGGTTGGLVGSVLSGGLLENCYSTVTVEGSGYTGGLAGRSVGEMVNCHASGAVASSSMGAGGLAGAFEGTASNCHASGTVTVTGTGTSTTAAIYAGGLMGRADGSLFCCSATGSVTATRSGSEVDCGGLLGEASGELDRCFATGNVSATNTRTVGDIRVNGAPHANGGGLVGSAGSSLTVSNSYARGNVTALGDQCLTGGLLGWLLSTSVVLQNCYATGNMEFKETYDGTTTPGKVLGHSAAGSLTGGGAPTLTGSFSLDAQEITITANPYLYGYPNIEPKLPTPLRQGTSLTAEQLRLQASFPGWNFYKNWKLDPGVNDGYPALRAPGEELEDPADRPDEPEAPRWVDGFLADPTAGSIDGFQPITSAAELAALSGSGGSYYLANDIMLEAKWEPISGFRGVLDGRGHCVSNLYVNASATLTYAGLFGTLEGAEIRNLAVSVAEVRGTAQMLGSSLFAASAGGIAGYADNTTFVNCYVIGGPVSARSSTIYIGGLLGEAGTSVSLTACYAENPVTVTQEDLNAKELACGAGGLVGSGMYAALSRCFATGDVSVRILNELGSNTIRAGGLVGGMYMGTAEDCYALGDVTVDSISDGGPGHLWIGGISAYAPQQSSRCYAAGDVRITRNAGASAGTSQAGALFGSRFSETVSDCYYSSAQTVEVPDGGSVTYAGTALTEAEMRTRSAYPGWTFGEGGWKIEEALNGGLPCFSGYRPATGSRAGYAGFLLDPAADPLPEGAIPVSSVADLKNMSSLAQGVTDPYYYLTHDLYLDEEWSGNYYAGSTFDGRGHHITNLHTDKKSYGLFYTVSGTVKNLAIHVGKEGFIGETGSSAMGPWTGALTPYAGYGAKIINCFVTGGKVSGNRAGGLVGNANPVNTSGSNTSISYCYTTVDVEGTDAGGLVGRNGESTSPTANLLIDHCYTTGTIRGTSAGGLVGNVHNEGAASAITNSYSTARVSAPRNSSGSTSSGGLIGLSSAYIMLQNCYAAGTVGSTGSTSGNLIGSGASNVTVLNCFSPQTQKVSGSFVSTQGKVLTPAEAGQKVSYSNWDFTNDWRLVPEWNGGYPVLKGYVPMAYASAANGNPNALAQGFLLDPLEDDLPAGATPIGTEAELKALGNREAGADGYFYLTRDIQLTGPWTPVRNFTGTLDGRGWAIRNLYTESGTSAGGLFASLGDTIATNYPQSNAVVRNLAIEIAPQGINGARYAGGLAAYAHNLMDSGSFRSGTVTIANCFVTGGPVSLQGRVTTSDNSFLPVGGLLGAGQADISYCYTAVDVTGAATELQASEHLLAGGIYGGAGGSAGAAVIDHCFSLGNVTARAEKAGNYASVNAGGIAGGFVGSYSGRIQYSYAMGMVSASGAADSSRSRAGGISGYSGTVSNCWTPKGQTMVGTASSGSSGYGLSPGTLGGLTSSQWALDSTGAVNKGYPYFPNTAPGAPSFIKGSVTCAFIDQPMAVELRRYGGNSYEAVSALTFQDAAYSSAAQKTYAFLFSTLQPGTYAVSIAKPRYQDYLSQSRTLASGEDLDLGALTLERLGQDITVSISPYDSTSTAKGQLLRGGEVIAEAESEPYGGSTDRLLFQDIPNGEYTLRITRPEYQTYSEALTVSGADLTKDVTLAKAPERLPGFTPRPDGFLQDPATGNPPSGGTAISTEAQLRAIGPSGSYYLTRDIALSGTWTPIPSFQGTLDGRGHRITNLSIPQSAARQNAGLFSVLSGGAEVKNLAVETASSGVWAASPGSSYIGNAAGILAATVSGNASITNCYTRGVVRTYTTGGIAPSGTAAPGTTDWCGGLVGMSTSTGRFTDCYSTADVFSTGYAWSYAGGLAGALSHGSVVRCFAAGDVTAVSGYQSHSGGLAGSSDQAITDSYAQGNVAARQTASGSRAASPALWAGGLVGVNVANGGISRCYASGDVRAEVNSILTLLTCAGGLVGMNYGQVSDAYALGDVTSSGCGGGLTGRSNKGACAARCYALGNISMTVYGSTSVVDAGRLTGDGRESGESFSGDLGLTFTNCYTSSAQRITYSRNDYISGIADAGTVKSPRELRDLGQLSGFSGSVWTVDGAVNRGYPYLRSMEAYQDPLEGLTITPTALGTDVRPTLITLRPASSGDRSRVDLELTVTAGPQTDLRFMAASYAGGKFGELYLQAGTVQGSGQQLTLRNVPRTLLYPTGDNRFKLLLVDGATWRPYMAPVESCPQPE